MLPIAYYFLQVVLCSALLMGYYLLVLRNKRFHRYNRFYLLAVAVLSWTVPLVKIRWGHQAIVDDPNMIRFLSVVADNNSQIEANMGQRGFQWSGSTLAAGLYFVVAGILLTGMFVALYKVYHLLKHHSSKNVDDVYLVLTRAQGTPFSFFRYIFWNEAIDLRSEPGKQILQHELTHVKQKHSADKIFIQLILVAGWFNPFFWLLKKEMEMIHEFIADKKAVDNGDTSLLAQMLLAAAYPGQQFALTNPFFFSPIRRRLQMLTNRSTPRFSYIRRLIVLPLLAVVVILFSFRSKEQRDHTLSVASVIKDVAEVITQQTNLQNMAPSNKSAATILQRLKEETVAFFQEEQDTTIVKLDTLTLRNGTNTFKWAVPKIIGMDSSKRLLKPILVSDKILYIFDGQIMDKSILASVNPNDIGVVAILKGEKGYEKYGEAGKYGAVLITTKSYIAKHPDNANSLAITNAHLTNREGNIVKYYPADTLIFLKDNNGQKLSKPPLIIIDGVKMPPGTSLNIIDINEIQSIDIYKDDMNSEKYGEEGKGGVIDVFTKRKPDTTITIINPFTKAVDHYTITKINFFPELFPGGATGWNKYLEENLNRTIAEKNGAPPGKYIVVVSFWISENGEVSKVRAENDPGYGTKAEAERIISTGPRWKPVVKDGKNISSLYRQSASFSFSAPVIPTNEEKKTAY